MLANSYVCRTYRVKTGRAPLSAPILNRVNIRILNIFDPELPLISTKPISKNKLKELSSELKNLKVQGILVLEYKWRIWVLLIATDSDIYEAFKSMHQSSMIKIKYANEIWVVVDIIKKHSIKIFECSISKNNSIDKQR